MYKYLNKDMSESEKRAFAKQRRNNVVVAALLLRLLILGAIYFLFITYEIRPFYIEDDMKYARLAERYLNVANSAFDEAAYNTIGASGYLATFWPYVVCTISYIFGSVWSARVLNVILSCVCVRLVYDLTYELSERYSTALLAAKLYAFMPYSAIVSCFPIKDIFLTMGVLAVFLLYVRLQKGIKVGLLHWIISVLLLWAMSETRGGVTEFLLLVAGIFLCVRFVEKKQTAKLIFAIFAMVIFLIMYGGSIAESFTSKMDTYFYTDRGSSTIALVRIDSLAQIYKLPVTYMFSQIMPLNTSWFSTVEISNLWSALISRTNVTAYPIAIGNFIYLCLCRKKNPVFYYASFAMYSAVIILSLGIFRHYYFLLPLSHINFALYSEEKTQFMSNLVVLGTMALAFMVLVFSVT